VRVETDFAVFGFVVEDGVVVRAAPITKWIIKQRGRYAVNYWRMRGGIVSWIKVDDEKQLHP
jgi:hypothetical protein